MYAVIAATRPGAAWTMLTCPDYVFPCFGKEMASQATAHQRSLLRRLQHQPFDPGNSVYWSSDGGELWLEAEPSGASSLRTGRSATVCSITTR